MPEETAPAPHTFEDHSLTSIFTIIETALGGAAAALKGSPTGTDIGLAGLLLSIVQQLLPHAKAKAGVVHAPVAK